MRNSRASGWKPAASGSDVRGGAGSSQRRNTGSLNMKIYMETMGCPKNFYDTQTALGILKENDFLISETADDADVLILNT